MGKYTKIHRFFERIHIFKIKTTFLKLLKSNGVYSKMQYTFSKTCTFWRMWRTGYCLILKIIIKKWYQRKKTVIEIYWPTPGIIVTVGYWTFDVVQLDSSWSIYPTTHFYKRNCHEVEVTPNLDCYLLRVWTWREIV